MRRFIATILLLSSFATLYAQQVYRSEFSVFDLREAALKNDHSKTEHHIPFAPKTIEAVDSRWSEYGMGELIDSPSRKYRKLLFTDSAECHE